MKNIKIVSIIRAIYLISALAIGGGLPASCAANYRVDDASADDMVARIDNALFSALLQQMQQESAPTEIRVDPRPLRRDPDLVTLHDFRVAPDLVSPEAQRSPLADVERARIAVRKELLIAAGISATDAFQDARCPGALAPPTDSVIARRKRLCPDEEYRSKIVSLPREGGAYWPDNVDERAKYGGRNVMTVRVISRLVSPDGSIEQSSDYVFEFSRDGQWEYIETKRLLIVE